MKQSAKYRLNWHDFFKALLIGAGTGIAMFVQECLSEKDFVFHWQGIGMAALGGICSYLIKNYFTTQTPQA